jgi:hypothetical protein
MLLSLFRWRIIFLVMLIFIRVDGEFAIQIQTISGTVVHTVSIICPSNTNRFPFASFLLMLQLTLDIRGTTLLKNQICNLVIPSGEAFRLLTLLFIPHTLDSGHY